MMDKAPTTSCERCNKGLPSMKPPRPRSGRYAEGSAGPVRVLLGGVEEWFCWSYCWKKAHPEKPGRAKKQKSQIKLRGSSSSPFDPVEEEAA